jgi:hypothetical protein
MTIGCFDSCARVDGGRAAGKAEEFRTLPDSRMFSKN